MQDPVLERSARRLMVKVSDSLVDVTNLRSAGMLELFAEGLNLQRRCQSIVGALMATLSKPLSKSSASGTTPLTAMFQVAHPPADGRDGAAAPPPAPP